VNPRLAAPLFGALILATQGLAAQERELDLLDAEAYRTDLEEVIVHGQAPRWRQPRTVEALRPEDIDFLEAGPDHRLDWFPRYTREERDAYQGVRDRKNETPELKLFEIHF